MTKKNREYRTKRRKELYQWRRKKPLIMADATYAGGKVYRVIPQYEKGKHGLWHQSGYEYMIDDECVSKEQYQAATEFMKYSKPMDMQWPNEIYI